MADERLTDFARTAMPFAATIGLEIDSSTPDKVVGGADWAPERCTTAGLAHGGFLMALADSIGAMCAVQHLPEGASTTTVESKTNFFRPVSGGRVHLTATPVHAGRRFITVQTDVSDDAGKLVARVTQTQAVLLP